MHISEDVASKLAGYYVNHRGFWRDVQRMRAVIKHLDDYRSEDLDALKQWYELHRDLIIEHHVAEDDFFFPRVAEEIGDSHVFDKMVDEHHLLDEVVEKLDKAFQEKDKAKLAKQLQAHADLVEEHLAHEEKLFCPITEGLDHGWCNRAESEFLKHMPMKTKIKSLPWALEDMDEITRKHFWSKLPFPAKLMYKFKLKKDYEKLIRAAIR